MKKIIHITSILLLILGFSQVQAKDPVRPANQIGVYPFTVTTDGLGLGVFYERDVGKSDKESFVMPVKFLIKSYDTYDQVIGGRSDFRNVIEFAPGMKFYPTNRNRAFTFALGPSLYYSYSAYEGYRHVENWSEPMVKEDFSKKIHSLGMLANVYLELAVVKQFIMGFQLGFGINYITREKDKVNHELETIRQEIFQPVAQMSLTFAYRF